MSSPGDFSEIFRTEWPSVVAILMREFRDIGLAEDSAQEAFLAATTRWPLEGWPESPGGWLVTTARRKAIDRLRRVQRFDGHIPELGRHADPVEGDRAAGLIDDRLALILGCCHPALAPEGQVALTLRVVCGLSTAQIARAFLVTESTMTRRITRAKQKIAGANIVFRVDRGQLDRRLTAVCAVIYSIYTEGHASATDASLVRGDLCEEALWLAGLLADLVPDEAEVNGLTALLLLTDARRSTRTSANGSVVLLADQDRDRWDQPKIAEGLASLARAHAAGRGGTYQFQAAIAALHTTAPSFEATDWKRIVGLYDVLISEQNDPVTALNRAAAIGHYKGPTAGLDALTDLSPTHLGQLADYSYLHACQGDFEARTGQLAAARRSFVRARRLTKNRAEREHLASRIALLAEPESLPDRGHVGRGRT